MKPGDIVTDHYRVKPIHPGSIQRKVYLVIGGSRVEDKVRVATWSHSAHSWSLPHTKWESDLCLAPADWPQTKAAQKWITARRMAAGFIGRKP